MSHTTTINKIDLSDIDALRAAINMLNDRGVKCDLLENAVPRAYSPNQAGMGEADYVLNLKNAEYDVGLYQQADGTFEPRTDFWGGSVEREIGVEAREGEDHGQARIGKFVQAYAAQAAMRKAIQQGHTVNMVDQEDGTIQLQIMVGD